MNDPNKRIDVNISSLLSLKAELLRKQEEVNRSKLKQSAETFIPKRGTKSAAPENHEEPRKDRKRTEEYEDSSLLDKSKKVLEAKSRFYDKMAASGGKLNSDDNCLVLFNQKKQDDRPYKDSSTESDISDDENETGKYKTGNLDEEWIEYTDCLGRTRQCLKKDLEFFKKKDSQLAENIQPRVELNQDAPMWMIDTKGTDNKDAESVMADDATEMTSIISKHDQQKMNWEKKEEENVFKENVHYQDVLFDEARTHGVGYYAFATDEEERAKQRKALDEMRKKTLEQQKQREAQRLSREKIIAERVKAAKNRQRARLGLPPVEDEPEPPAEPLYDSKAEEKRKKKEEREKRRREREEMQREEERKQHIRPWDKNKPGVPPTNDSSDSENGDNWNYKPEREPMSQEQWNERKRDERNPEFAPVSGPSAGPPLRQFHAQPPPATYAAPESEDAGPNPLFFTTKKATTRPTARKFTKRNYSAAMEDDENQTSSAPITSFDQYPPRGAEIPPPPTFEYYGPTSAKREKLAKPDLEKSIEAGLKFLRNQSDKGVLPTKSSWTSKADYD